jgi:hypothetical protein
VSASNKDKEQNKISARDKLYDIGAKEQCIRFLLSSVGAGKTTFVKFAQFFSFDFAVQ